MALKQMATLVTFSRLNNPVLTLEAVVAYFHT